MKLRVKEDKRLVRDSTNLAILNTDTEVLSFHERKMRQLRKEKAHEDEINNLKRDISEIKELLAKLLQTRT